MTMKLHSFSCTIVFSWNSKIRYFLHSRQGANGKLAVKFINCSNSFQLHKIPGPYVIFQFRCLIIMDKYFYGHGIGVICYIKYQNCSFIFYFTTVKTDYLSTNNHFSHLA